MRKITRGIPGKETVANLVLGTGVVMLCLSFAFIFEYRTSLGKEQPKGLSQKLLYSDQMRQSALQAYSKDSNQNTYSYETDQIPAPLVGN